MATASRRWIVLGVIALAAVAVISIRQQATKASAAAGATFSVSSGGTHALNETFSVSVALSDASFDATSPSWAGYDLELEYDGTVVKAMTASLGGDNPCTLGGNNALSPAVVGGCEVQDSTASGFTIETITFKCIGSGTTTLHLPARTDQDLQGGPGNALIDGNNRDFPMVLTDSSAACDAALPTATATPASPGSATFSVGTGGTHALNEEFTVPVNLSVTFATVSAWSGFESTLDYDSDIVHVAAVSTDVCQGWAWWVVKRVGPPLTTSCIAQDSTMSSGVIETVMLVCVGAGTSPLHLLPDSPDNQLVDVGQHEFLLTLIDGSVTCDGAAPTATDTPTATATTVLGTATPTPTPSGAPDTATFAITAPSGPQALNLPFLVTTDLTSFVPGSQRSWAGYGIDLAYDPSVLAVDYLADGDLCPPTVWASPRHSSGEIATGCAFQDNTATGALDRIVLRCLQDGTSALHFVSAPPPSFPTFLFDFSGAPFGMTTQDATVTCDQQVDSDSDACGNSAESALGLNPNDPWDFYSVPAPSLLVAPDPHLAFKGGTISAGDAQAVFTYFKAGAKLGTLAYDQDLNGNGVADGLEYDRSVAGPAMSGPPRGVITAGAAQLAFAQFKRGYSC